MQLKSMTIGCGNGPCRRRTGPSTRRSRGEARPVGSGHRTSCAWKHGDVEEIRPGWFARSRWTVCERRSKRPKRSPATSRAPAKTTKRRGANESEAPSASGRSHALQFRVADHPHSERRQSALRLRKSGPSPTFSRLQSALHPQRALLTCCSVARCTPLPTIETILVSCPTLGGNRTAQVRCLRMPKRLLPSSPKGAPQLPPNACARSRERQRKGLRCLTIELRETEIDALVRRKRLSNDDRSNLAAIRTALYLFLDDYLR